ncbi:phage virion morphogenesis protein [Methylomonas rapida]|uniref:Phage virion morphogenesis protein n=1 Tax=Methylomonas rapida TaxID=2963939 RepID=A0ABY7GF50_9GAMM|nr:phage virion morphogenesis protein [Methylomonas rapida]WAR43622.1 phage virion morphogenesis protein [Methylomonas rapida]
MQFELEFDTSHLTYVLRAARGEIEHPEGMLDSIGFTLLQQNRKRHDAGLDPNGQPWKPLSPLTLQATDPKTKQPIKRKSQQPLLRSGEMLKALHKDVNGDELRVFFWGNVEAERARYHQFGTKPRVITPRNSPVLAFAGIVTKRVNHPGLPKRELIGFPDSDRDLVENVATDHLQRVLQQARAK